MGLEQFTDEIKARCAGICGDLGDPPCYRLHELTSDAKAEDIKPCAQCLHPQLWAFIEDRLVVEARKHIAKVVADELKGVK